MWSHEKLVFRLGAETDLEKTGLLESSPELYFRITYSISDGDFTVTGNGSQCICTYHEFVEPTTVHFWANMGLLNGDPKGLDKFSQRLSSLGMDSELEQILVSDVILEARGLIMHRGGRGDDKIIKRFNLTMHLKKCRYFNEVDVVEMQSMAEYEERNYGMVRADPSSLIGMMKSVKLEDKCEEEDGEICSVCLEEVVDIASAMPCAHLFHENCILKWLQTSHVCPVCRFPMPVD